MADNRIVEVDSGNVSMLYVTCGSVEEAKSIARALVGDRLIACANIIERMQSIYWWQGDVAEEDETVLILKTVSAHVDRVIESVRTLHSYDIPLVVELPLARGNPAFLEWVMVEASGRRTS